MRAIFIEKKNGNFVLAEIDFCEEKRRAIEGSAESWITDGLTPVDGKIVAVDDGCFDVGTYDITGLSDDAIRV